MNLRNARDVQNVRKSGEEFLMDLYTATILDAMCTQNP